MEWAVEDLGAADLELEDGQFVAVAGVGVGGGERARQDAEPPPDEALDVRSRQAVADGLEGPPVIDRGEAVVEGLVADVATLQLALRPAVAVQPYPHAPGSVRADLEEGTAEVAVPEVEVDVVDVGARTGGRVATDHAPPLGWRAEHARPLLGETDQDDPLATGRLGGIEMGLGDSLLALTPLEVDERDARRLCQPFDLTQEGLRPLAQDGVAGDLLPRLVPQEAGEALGCLEPGHVAVEEDPVDALVAQGHAVIEQGVDIDHGDPPGHGWGPLTMDLGQPLAKGGKGLRPSRRQPAQASLVAGRV